MLEELKGEWYLGGQNLRGHNDVQYEPACVSTRGVIPVSMGMSEVKQWGLRSRGPVLGPSSSEWEVK